MANTKSAIKRIRQNEKRHARNRYYKSGARTFVKKARLALKGDDSAKAQEVTMSAVAVLDRAAQKGIIHKNNAARRKSRLMRQLAALKK